VTFELFVSGSTATTGTVTDAGGSAVPFSVTPGSVTTLPITDGHISQGTVDGVSALGVHVTLGGPRFGVRAQPVQRGRRTPSRPCRRHRWECANRIASYTPLGGGLSSRISVVGTVDGTTISVSPAATIGGHTAGVPFDISLDAGDVYSLASDTDDLTGFAGDVGSTSGRLRLRRLHQHRQRRGL